MNFFRRPFQFSSPDVSSRQSELKQRFGLPEDKSTMLIESPNVHSSMISGSPRLQHRIPDVFDEPEEMKSSVIDSVDSTKQAPKVRIIPIQLEGSARHDVPIHKSTKTRDCPHPVENNSSNVICNSQDEDEDFSPVKPRMHDIPIKVDNVKTKPVINKKLFNGAFQSSNGNKKSQFKKNNGLGLTKGAKKQSSPAQVTVTPKISGVVASMKQIEDVLKEFSTWKESVEKFKGTQGDKQYRYLDETLMRCMLKLDDVQTFGNEEIRKSRKAAVTEIQTCINVLESKGQSASSAADKHQSEKSSVDSELADNGVVSEDNEKMDVCLESREQVVSSDVVKSLPFDGSVEPTESSDQSADLTGSSILPKKPAAAVQLEADPQDEDMKIPEATPEYTSPVATESIVKTDSSNIMEVDPVLEQASPDDSPNVITQVTIIKGESDKSVADHQDSNTGQALIQQDSVPEAPSANASSID